MPDRRPVLGVLGGGQLARMLALAARPLGVDCLVVEPAVDEWGSCPAGPVAEVIAGHFTDPSVLAALAARCDVVTVETENVPVESLMWLAERVEVRPGPAAVAVTQDRLAEKLALRDAGIATAPFDEVDRGDADFPALVKTRRGGYDGRGQVLVRSAADLYAAVEELSPAIVEGLVPFERELSIVAARSIDGEVRSYPLVENLHVGGILRRTTAPARSSAALQSAADGLAGALMERLDYIGVLAIELFDVGGRLVANEVAPRVHNSGHWTIEGAVTSQFEQHVRAVLGLPLGSSEAMGHSVMLNCIGVMPQSRDVLAIPGAHLHDYGKVARAGRKVGHVTLTAPTTEMLASAVERCEVLVH